MAKHENFIQVDSDPALDTEQQNISLNSNIIAALTAYRDKRGALFNKYMFYDIFYGGESYEHSSQFQKVAQTDQLIERIKKCKTHEDYVQLLYKTSDMLDKIVDHKSAFKALLLETQKQCLGHLQQTNCSPELLQEAARVTNHNFRQYLIGELQYYITTRLSPAGGADFVKDQFNIGERNRLFSYVTWLNSILIKIDAAEETYKASAIYLEYLEACAFVLNQVGDKKHTLYQSVLKNQQAVAIRFSNIHPGFHGDERIYAFNAASTSLPENSPEQVKLQQAYKGSPKFSAGKAAEVKLGRDEKAAEAFELFQKEQAEENDRLKLVEFQKFLTEAIIRKIKTSRIIKSGKVPVKPDAFGTIFNLLGVMSSSMGTNPMAEISAAGRALTPIAVAAQLANEQKQLLGQEAISQSVDYDKITDFAEAVSEIITRQYTQGIQKIYRDGYFHGNYEIIKVADMAGDRVTGFLEDITQAKPHEFPQLVKAAANAVSNRAYHSNLPLKANLIQPQTDTKTALIDHGQGENTIQKFFEETPDQVEGQEPTEEPGVFGYRIVTTEEHILKTKPSIFQHHANFILHSVENKIALISDIEVPENTQLNKNDRLTTSALQLQLQKSLTEFYQSRPEKITKTPLQLLLEKQNISWQWYKDYLTQTAKEIPGANLSYTKELVWQLTHFNKTLTGLSKTFTDLKTAEADFVYNLQQQVTQQQFSCFNKTLIHALVAYRNKTNTNFNRYFPYNVYYRGKATEPFSKHQKLKNTDALIESLQKCRSHEDYYRLLIKISGIVNNIHNFDPDFKNLLLNFEEQILQHLRATDCNPPVLELAAKVSNYDFRRGLVATLLDYQNTRLTIFGGFDFLKDQINIKERNELFSYIDWLNSTLAQIKIEDENEQTSALYTQYIEACALVLQKINNPKHALSIAILENQEKVLQRFLNHHPKFKDEELLRARSAVIASLKHDPQKQQQLSDQLSNLTADLTELPQPNTKLYQTQAENALKGFQHTAEAENDRCKIKDYQKFLTDAIINNLLASRVISTGKAVVQANDTLLGFSLNILSIITSGVAKNPDLITSLAGIGAGIPVGISQLIHHEYLAHIHGHIANRVDYQDISKFAARVAANVTAQYHEGILKIYNGPYAGDNAELVKLADLGARRILSFLEDDGQQKPEDFEAFVKATANSVSNRHLDSLVPLKETPLQLQGDPYRKPLNLSTGSAPSVQGFYEERKAVYPGMEEDDESLADTLGVRHFASEEDYRKFMRQSAPKDINIEPKAENIPDATIGTNPAATNETPAVNAEKALKKDTIVINFFKQEQSNKIKEYSSTAKKRRLSTLFSNKGFATKELLDLLDNSNNPIAWCNEYLTGLTQQIKTASPEHKKFYASLLANFSQLLASLQVPTQQDDLTKLKAKTLIQRFNYFNEAQLEPLENYRILRDGIITRNFLSDLKYRGISEQKFTKHQKLKAVKEIKKQLSLCQTHQDYYQLLIRLFDEIEATDKHQSRLKQVLLNLQTNILELMRETRCDPSLLTPATKISTTSFINNLISGLQNHQTERQSFLYGGRKYFKDRFYSTQQKLQHFSYVDYLKHLLSKASPVATEQKTTEIYAQYIEASAIFLNEIKAPQDEAYKTILDNHLAILYRFKFQGVELARVYHATLPLVENDSERYSHFQKIFPKDSIPTFEPNKLLSFHNQTLDDYETFKAEQKQKNNERKLIEFKQTMTDEIINNLLNSETIKSGKVLIQPGAIGKAFNFLGILSAGMGLNTGADVALAGKVLSVPAIIGDIATDQLLTMQHTATAESITDKLIAPLAIAVAEKLTAQFAEGIYMVHRDPYANGRAEIKKLAKAGAKYILNYIENELVAKPNNFDDLVNAACNAVTVRAFHSAIPGIEPSVRLQDEDPRLINLNGPTLNDFYERTTATYPGMLHETKDGFANKKGTLKQAGGFGWRQFETREQYKGSQNPGFFKQAKNQKAKSPPLAPNFSFTPTTLRVK